MTSLEHAFELLDHAASAYTLTTNSRGGFEAEVHVGAHIGRASGEPKARAITIALAQALGLETPEEVDVPTPTLRRPRSRSSADGI